MTGDSRTIEHLNMRTTLPLLERMVTSTMLRELQDMQKIEEPASKNTPEEPKYKAPGLHIKYEKYSLQLPPIEEIGYTLAQSNDSEEFRVFHYALQDLKNQKELIRIPDQKVKSLDMSNIENKEKIVLKKHYLHKKLLLIIREKGDDYFKALLEIILFSDIGILSTNSILSPDSILSNNYNRDLEDQISSFCYIPRTEKEDSTDLPDFSKGKLVDLLSLVDRLKSVQASGEKAILQLRRELASNLISQRTLMNALNLAQDSESINETAQKLANILISQLDLVNKLKLEQSLFDKPTLQQKVINIAVSQKKIIDKLMSLQNSKDQPALKQELVNVLTSHRGFHISKSPQASNSRVKLIQKLIKKLTLQKELLDKLQQNSFNKTLCESDLSVLLISQFFDNPELKLDLDKCVQLVKEIREVLAQPDLRWDSRRLSEEIFCLTNKTAMLIDNVRNLKLIIIDKESEVTQAHKTIQEELSNLYQNEKNFKKFREKFSEQKELGAVLEYLALFIEENGFIKESGCIDVEKLKNKLYSLLEVEEEHKISDMIFTSLQETINSLLSNNPSTNQNLYLETNLDTGNAPEKKTHDIKIKIDKGISLPAQLVGNRCAIALLAKITDDYEQNNEVKMPYKVVILEDRYTGLLRAMMHFRYYCLLETKDCFLCCFSPCLPSNCLNTYLSEVGILLPSLKQLQLSKQPVKFQPSSSGHRSAEESQPLLTRNQSSQSPFIEDNFPSSTQQTSSLPTTEVEVYVQSQDNDVEKTCGKNTPSHQARHDVAHSSNHPVNSSIVCTETTGANNNHQTLLNSHINKQPTDDSTQITEGSDQPGPSTRIKTGSQSNSRGRSSNIQFQSSSSTVHMPEQQPIKHLAYSTLARDSKSNSRGRSNRIYSAAPPHQLSRMSKQKLPAPPPYESPPPYSDISVNSSIACPEPTGANNHQTLLNNPVTAQPTGNSTQITEVGDQSGPSSFIETSSFHISHADHSSHCFE